MAITRYKFKCNLDAQECMEECKGNTELKLKCDHCMVTYLSETTIFENEKNKAAMEYATKMSKAPDKETPDWIITDFLAGVEWYKNFLESLKE